MDEVLNIISLYPNTPNRIIAGKYGLSVSQVKNLAIKHNLKKDQDYKRIVLRKDTWKKEDVDTLIEMYPNTTNKDIAAHFSVSIATIKNKANVLNLKKSSDHINKGVFTKGHEPWSKGKKGLRLSPGTEFKKGEKPWNTKFDGCITLRFDKLKSRPYKFIRIENNRWIHLHRYLYIQHYGQIPKDKVIVFKDNNSLNLSIENLIPITRQELLSRNIISNFKDASKIYEYIIGRITSFTRRAEIKRRKRDSREEARAERLTRRAEIKRRKRDSREEARAERLTRRAEIKRRKRLNTRRVGTDFIETKTSINPLMEMGEQHLGLAIKFVGSMDNAKDGIMNTICYFIEGNIEPTNEEFSNRLILECKLLRKHSYKEVSFHDMEYKLTELGEYSL